MGFGVMNIWVRNEDCEVIDDRRAHLHVYNCHGKQIFDPAPWFGGGHTEIKVPPGCYIVTAGVVYGNRYTDKTMVVVSCDQKVCVNLVLNRFEEKKARERPDYQLAPIARGCGPRLLGPLFLAAKDKGAAGRAAGVILQAAGIDKKEMAAGLREEVAFLKKHKKEWAKDPGDPEAYLAALEGLTDVLEPGQQK